MVVQSVSERTNIPRLRRWVITSLGVVVLLIIGLVGWTLYQNTYDIREEKVTITGGIGAASGSPGTSRSR